MASRLAIEDGATLLVIAKKKKLLQQQLHKKFLFVCIFFFLPIISEQLCEVLFAYKMHASDALFKSS